MGVFQARILEWVAMPSSRGSAQPRDQTQVSRVAGRCFTGLSHQGSPMTVSVQFNSVTQSCQTLCDPMTGSTPGLSVHHQLDGYELE